MLEIFKVLKKKRTSFPDSDPLYELSAKKAMLLQKS